VADGDESSHKEGYGVRVVKTRDEGPSGGTAIFTITLFWMRDAALKCLISGAREECASDFMTTKKWSVERGFQYSALDRQAIFSRTALDLLAGMKVTTKRIGRSSLPTCQH